MNRITRSEAIARFKAGMPIVACPHKMRPDGPFSSGATIPSREYLESAERCRNEPTMWKGTISKTAWKLMLDNWTYYNASYETGYYPWFYLPLGD